MWIRLLWFTSLLPVLLSLSYLHFANLLEPSQYILRLTVRSDMAKLQFTYYVDNEVHFDLKVKSKYLVLETTAQHVYGEIVSRNHTNEQLNVKIVRREGFYVIRMKNKSLFEPGHYTAFTKVVGLITEITNGIRYNLHRDRKTKRLTYTIMMDLFPNYAKDVFVATHNVNKPCEIRINVLCDLGFRVYFVKQALSQTVEEDPYLPDVVIVDGRSGARSDRTHAMLNSTMYSMTMPLSMVVLYISENVRKTIGSLNFSATVTADRNQIGQFSPEYGYVVDLFYRYVKEYSLWGPRKLPLPNQDVVLHLRKNVPDIVYTSHTHCTISELFVLQSHRSVAILNALMGRCMAANHIMSRRYPKYWDSYYILVGLREYYAIIMRLPGGGLDRDHEYSGIGLQQITSFSYDDRESDQPLLGGFYSEADVYLYMNYLRALSLMHMLKHLIGDSKDAVFYQIVAEFLSNPNEQYDRESFTEAFRTVTGNDVFKSQKTINGFFDSWTMQYGYPIVDVHRESHLLTVVQQVCPVSQNVIQNQTFIIPINVLAESVAIFEVNDTQPYIWLRQKSETFSVPNMGRWFVINNQRASYFRVRYDDMNYNLLRFELLRGNLRKFSPVTRGQILDDVLFFAKIGARIRYETALGVLEYLHRETDETTWAMVSDELRELALLLRFTPAYPYFKHFMQISVLRFYMKGADELNRLSKYALQWACFGELTQCKAATYNAFKKLILYRASFEHLDEIICYGVRSMDTATFRYIKISLLLQLETLDFEMYVSALSCLDNYQQLKESLNMIFRKTSQLAAIMEPGHKERVLTGMCRNSQEGCQAILNFIFQQPKLVLAGLGEERFKTVLSNMAHSIYQRRHQRRLRLVLMYLNITDTEVIWAAIQSKRTWLMDNLATVTQWLQDFARDRKTPDYSYS